MAYPGRLDKTVQKSAH